MRPNIAEVLSQYESAFMADCWKVQLKNRLTDKAFRVEYTSEQLVRAGGYLSFRNREGFDIYARPLGLQYVLLDDLTRDVLADLATLQPCALLETSPNNYQAWLILQNIPSSRDEAKAICRELAQRFGADLASADPDHVGRLPGFTNRKKKYQQEDGLYPFVLLHRFMRRNSLFTPSGAVVLKENEPLRRSNQNVGHSASEKDFGIACGLIRKGLSDEQITAYLINNSPKLNERKGAKYLMDYLQTTIRNARKQVR